MQIIESLTPEERNLLFERLSSKPIQVTAGVCGGQPRIRNTRISVWTLVAFRKQGADDATTQGKPTKASLMKTFSPLPPNKNEQLSYGKQSATTYFDAAGENCGDER